MPINSTFQLSWENSSLFAKKVIQIIVNKIKGSGILKEITEHENRVSITPEIIKKISSNHEIYIESGAGFKSYILPSLPLQKTQFSLHSFQRSTDTKIGDFPDFCVLK